MIRASNRNRFFWSMVCILLTAIMSESRVAGFSRGQLRHSLLIFRIFCSRSFHPFGIASSGGGVVRRRCSLIFAPSSLIWIVLTYLANRPLWEIVSRRSISELIRVVFNVEKKRRPTAREVFESANLQVERNSRRSGSHRYCATASTSSVGI